MLLTATLSWSSQTRVVLDPGHGGADAGTFQAGIREADVVLKFADKLKQRLAADPRFFVAMTRETDVKLTLADRVQRAALQKADVFVSLHMNSSTDERAQGPEIYFQGHLTADDDALLLAAIENQKENSQLAQASPTSLSKSNDLALITEDLRLNAKIKRSFRLARIFARRWPLGQLKASRAIRQGPFFVINNGPAASVLIELGYLSHPHDRTLMSQAETQTKLADEFYKSLIEFHQHTR